MNVSLHEIQNLRTAVTTLVAAGKRGVLVTVAGTRGSTYRRAGARCVISEDGAAFGAISGGCVEKDLAERAKAWLSDMQPRMLTYDSSAADDVVFGLGLGCRGKIELLIEPFDARTPPRLPDASGEFVTVISCSSGAHRIGSATHADCCSILVEHIEPQRRIAIFGGGADVRPVADLARAMGWVVDIIDAREFETPQADAAVVMTHNFLRDVSIVEKLIGSPARYIGLLGPKSRGDEILTQVGDVDRRRIFSPIGLDLGGDAPEDIALSIVSEISAVLNGKNAPFLRDKPAPIHDRTVAVVLAAGFSTRLGRPKQLLDFRGEPLVRHAASVALGARCDETIVVGPYEEALKGLDVTVIDSPDAAEGMSASIRAAVQHATGARMLFTVCDQPLVTAEHLRTLVATKAPIVATQYADTVGVPAIFAPTLRDELLALRGDTGARALINAHRDEVVAIRFDAAAVDIDTAADYQKL